jgi:hypothetical protein
MLREGRMTAPTASETRTNMLMKGGADPALETRACASTSFEVTKPDTDLFFPDLDPVPFEPKVCIKTSAYALLIIKQNMTKCGKGTQNT